MFVTSRSLALTFALGAALLASCTRHDDTFTRGTMVDGRTGILGAGSTFASPLYEKWIAEYQKVQPKVVIRYDSVGSGEGQTRFFNGRVDFGVTEAPPSKAELVALKPSGMAIPVASGSIVLAYHKDQLPDGLRLPRDVYVDIFLGKITHWNDPRIAAANPSVVIPSLRIQPVVRLDSSGTTYAFTSHLSAISAAWRDGPGVGKRVGWPSTFIQLPGNERIAGEIKQLQGAIGYVEYGTARMAGLGMASLENKQGELIAPSNDATQLAIGDASSDLEKLATLNDPAGKGAYPIVTCTWLLISEHYHDAKSAESLRDFVRWCITKGQDECEPLGYIPLAPAVIVAARQTVDSLIQ